MNPVTQYCICALCAVVGLFAGFLVGYLVGREEGIDEGIGMKSEMD